MTAPDVDELEELASDMRALLTGTPPLDRPAPGPSPARERLAELDALTDRIPPLLDHMDHIWRNLEEHGFHVRWQR